MTINFRYQDIEAETLEALAEQLLNRYDKLTPRPIGIETWRTHISEGAFGLLHPFAEPHPRIIHEWVRSFVQSCQAEAQTMQSMAVRSKAVFISHRRIDKKEGERVARLAKSQGVRYWLDVHDPVLLALDKFGGSLANYLKAAIVAVTVEIALLNCTHVVALLTQNSVGSQWIPYEYGRVKGDLVYAPRNTASWVYGGSVVPEYAYLGTILTNDNQFRNWLAVN